MRKCGKGHVFDNPNVKREMLILRIKGYPYLVLARRYGVDHTTILYHCQYSGICLKENVREKMFILLRVGMSIPDISQKLNILEDVIKFYIEICGSDESRIFSRRTPWVSKKSIKLPPILEKIVHQKKHKKKKEEPLLTLIRTDSRGVEWLQDNRGMWICVGKTREKILFDEEEKKKKALELKRLQMLAY